MNVLITGGTGFIGKNLLEIVSNRGWNTFVILSKLETAQKITDIKHVSTIKSVDIFNGSYDKTVFDCCINMAAGGVTKEESMNYLIDANIGYSAKVFEFCKKKKIKRIIHIGSCSEYGKKEYGKLIKETDTLEPITFYGSTKAAFSILSMTFSKVNKMPLTVLRPFQVFGKHESMNRLVPQVMKSIYYKKELDLTHGNQVRDFIFVEDLVNAIVLACEAEKTLNGVYNVCSSNGLSLRNFVEKAYDILDGDKKLLNFGALESRKFEPKWIVGDNSKLIKSGWSVKNKLENSIIETYKWFSNYFERT